MKLGQADPKAVAKAKFLDGFVLFHPPPKVPGRRRIFPDHATMQAGEPYGLKAAFDRLEKWAVRGMRKYPGRKYGFKMIARNTYLVGFVE